MENNFFLNSIDSRTEDMTGIFRVTRKQRAAFEVPFTPRRQNILLLGVDSNGAGTDM